jgi:hypothetical protein
MDKISLEKFLTQFRWDKSPDHLPKLLYHYTNAAGLIGILKSESLWATSQAFMNDAKEFDHALDMLQECLKKRSQTTNVEEKNLYLALSQFLETPMRTPWFIISLSEKSDLLSQWRAYGGKGGYNIGFSCDKLVNILHQKYFLVKCIYSFSEQVDLIDQLFYKTLGNIFNGTLERDRLKITDLFIDDFMSDFLKMAIAFKHPTFEEEREWRLVPGFYKQEEIRLRNTESLLVPFVECSLKADRNNAIESICIGPNPYPALAKLSVLELGSLFKKDWRYQITTSPYRLKKTDERNPAKTFLSHARHFLGSMLLSFLSPLLTPLMASTLCPIKVTCQVRGLRNATGLEMLWDVSIDSRIIMSIETEARNFPLF